MLQLAFCWLYSTMSILQLACFDRGSNQVIARLRIDWLNSNSGSSGDWNSLTSLTRHLPCPVGLCQWGGGGKQGVDGVPCGSIRLAGVRHLNVINHIKLIKWNTRKAAHQQLTDVPFLYAFGHILPHFSSQQYCANISSLRMCWVNSFDNIEII